jgi:vitamin B12 transporter
MGIPLVENMPANVGWVSAPFRARNPTIHGCCSKLLGYGTRGRLTQPTGRDSLQPQRVDRKAGGNLVWTTSSYTALAVAAGALAWALPTWAQAPQELPGIVVQGVTLDVPKPAAKPVEAAAKSAAQPKRAPTPAPQSVAPSTAASVPGPAAPVTDVADDTARSGGIPAENTGTSLTVVTAADLKNQQLRNAAEALRSLPGVSVSHTGGFAGLTQLRIRGAEANHTLVLIDGIEANAGHDGEFDFSDLSADDIERIEILRGAQSGLYGSKAIGGVVNIITKGGRGPLTVTGSVEGGSYKTRDVTARVSGGNDKGYVSIGVHRRESDGFNIAPARDPANPTFRDTDDNVLTSFSFKAGGQISKDASVDVVLKNISKNGGRDGFGGPVGALATAIDDPSRFSSNVWLAGANLKWDLFDGAFSQALRANHNSTRRIDDDRGAFPFVSDNIGETNKFGYLATWRFTLPMMPAAKHSVSGLIEKQFDTFQPRSDGTTGEDFQRSQIGKVLEYRGEFADRLLVTGSVRHDNNDSFQDFTTWRSNASLKLPEIAMRPHASVGTGVKYPTFYEQYGFIPGFFIPNPNLKPETSFGWDAGVEFTVLKDRATLDFTYFKTNLENKITSLGFPTTLTNETGEATRQGIEVAGRYKVSAALSLGLSYTYLDAKDADGQREIRRAPHGGRLDVNYGFDRGRGNFNVAAAYNGRTDDTAFRIGVDPTFGFTTFTPERVKLDDFLLITAAASYKLQPGVEIFGRIENLANQKYQEVYGFETAGITAFAGLRFTYQDVSTIGVAGK